MNLPKKRRTNISRKNRWIKFIDKRRSERKTLSQFGINKNDGNNLEWRPKNSEKNKFSEMKLKKLRQKADNFKNF